MENNTNTDELVPHVTEVNDDKMDQKPDGIDDRHTNQPDTHDEKSFDMTDDDGLEAVVLPASKKSILMKLVTAIENMSADQLKNTYSKQELGVSGVNIQNTTLSNDSDVYSEPLDNHPDDWVNDINYSDKKLNITRHAVKAKGALTGASAIAKFASKLAIGEYTSVPLWHSGFWATIRPPYDDDVVNLESALAGNEIRLGRDTSTLVYSNYSVVYNRILSDFIVSHITTTSLDLPNDASILDHISVQDYYPLLLGLITSMNPKGYTFIKNCINTVVLNEDKTPKCDYSVTGTVNPMNMLRVDRKALSKKMLEQMSKRSPNSVSLDEVKEYQLGLNKTNNKSYNLKTSNGSIIKITLGAPSMSDYVDNGEAWINNIIDKTERLFTDADSDDRKNEKVQDTLNAIILGVYNIFVKKIETDDGDFVEDRELINDVLDMLSSENSLLKEYLDIVRQYIDGSAIAIVATSAFTCPKCKSEQEVSTSKVFESFIPINALEHFFVISTHRLEKVRNRTVSE